MRRNTDLRRNTDYEKETGGNYYGRMMMPRCHEWLTTQPRTFFILGDVPLKDNLPS